MAKVIEVKREPRVCTFRVGESTITAKLEEFPSDILDQLAVLGLSNKIGDAGAKPCDPETGKPQTPEAKFAAMKAVYNSLLAGQWMQARTSGGKPANDVATAERLEVLSHMFKLPVERVGQWCSTRTPEQRIKAFTSPEFQIELAKHRARGVKTDKEVFAGL